MSDSLLAVENLRVGFRQGGDVVTAVDGVSFAIRRGETFALVGESGSGKSVTALSVLRLLPLNGRILAGSARLNGQDLFRVPEIDLCAIRGRRIGIIFQDPMTSLNPVTTIGRQIGEVLRRQRGLKGAALRKRATELLAQVGMPRPEQHLDEYPHQFSGGMRQRAMIAIALAGEPDLLIADEPTTALDVTIQAQILDLLRRLQKETGMALWLITHDLGIVAEMADRVAVMRRGRIVEAGASGPFFAAPQHPYSLQLFDAMPSMESCRGRQRAAKDEEFSLPFSGGGQGGGELSESPAARTPGAPPLLQVRDFKVYYPVKKGLFQRTVDHVRAVDGVSFSLPAGSTLALVGESGCGKTTLGKAMLNLIDSTDGVVLFDGVAVDGGTGEVRRKRCAEMQIIFQDPYSSMNPRLIVGDIIEEGMRALLPELRADERRQRTEALLTSVGLPKESRLRYPHEFSGGQRQRICIARALAVNPKLIVCDEPTSALDVSVQKQIINLLKDLQKKQGLSYLFISHDLAVVAELADQVAVMHRGQIVEMGTTEDVLFAPSHPYTQKLLQAAPRLHKSR